MNRALIFHSFHLNIAVMVQRSKRLHLPFKVAVSQVCLVRSNEARPFDKISIRPVKGIQAYVAERKNTILPQPPLRKTQGCSQTANIYSDFH